jgi:hypothetical protein
LAVNPTGYPIGVIYKREGKHSMLDEQASLRSRFPHDKPATVDTLFKKFQS